MFFLYQDLFFVLYISIIFITSLSSLSKPNTTPDYLLCTNDYLLFAASSVFFISPHMVIGPTPLGTGVI